MGVVFSLGLGLIALGFGFEVEAQASGFRLAVYLLFVPRKTVRVPG